MKKWTALALVFACMMGIFAPAALAEGLTRAFEPVDLKPFEEYSGFTLDEETGDWSLHSNEAEALLRSVREGALRNYTGSGAAVFHLQLEGNELSGRVRPVLYVYYMGPRLNAAAMSVRVGDVRYDFAVAADIVDLGSGEVERMRALLDESGIEMLKEMATSTEQYTIRLHGDDSYTTKLINKKTYDNAKTRLESHSLSCLDLFNALDAVKYESYGMRPENEEEWYLSTDVRPQFQQVDLTVEDYPTGNSVPALDKVMKMLSSETSSNNVKLLENKLIEMRYLAGTANNTYGTSTVRAVEDIQRMYGLIPTGSVDGELLKILFSETMPPVPASDTQEPSVEGTPVTSDTQAEAGVAYSVEGAAQLTLNRYWIANTVTTSKPVGTVSQHAAANRDNLLLAVDGTIKNLSPEEMSFSRSVVAKMTLNDQYAFDVTIKCESDGGERFDSYLLPMGETRVVFMAEVPASALNEGEWALNVTLGGVTLNYALMN